MPGCSGLINLTIWEDGSEFENDRKTLRHSLSVEFIPVMALRADAFLEMSKPIKVMTGKMLLKNHIGTDYSNSN